MAQAMTPRPIYTGLPTAIQALHVRDRIRRAVLHQLRSGAHPHVVAAALEQLVGDVERVARRGDAVGRLEREWTE